MQVTFKYMAQVRKEAGTEVEEVVLDDGLTLEKAISELTRQHGDAFGKLVLKEDGSIQPCLLTLVNGNPVELTQVLSEGDEITILSAVAGG